MTSPDLPGKCATFLHVSLGVLFPICPSPLPIVCACTRRNTHTCMYTYIHICTHSWCIYVPTNATDGLEPPYLLPLAAFLSHPCQREHGWASQFLGLLTTLLFETLFPTSSPFSFTSSLTLSHRLTHSHLLDLTSQRGMCDSPVFPILRPSMFRAALGGAGGSLFSYST